MVLADKPIAQYVLQESKHRSDQRHSVFVSNTDRFELSAPAPPAGSAEPATYNPQKPRRQGLQTYIPKASRWPEVSHTKAENNRRPDPRFNMRREEREWHRTAKTMPKSETGRAKGENTRRPYCERDFYETVTSAGDLSETLSHSSSPAMRSAVPRLSGTVSSTPPGYRSRRRRRRPKKTPLCSYDDPKLGPGSYDPPDLWSRSASPNSRFRADGIPKASASFRVPQNDSRRELSEEVDPPGPGSYSAGYQNMTGVQTQVGRGGLSPSPSAVFRSPGREGAGRPGGRLRNKYLATSPQPREPGGNWTMATDAAEWGIGGSRRTGSLCRFEGNAQGISPTKNDKDSTLRLSTRSPTRQIRIVKSTG